MADFSSVANAQASGYVYDTYQHPADRLFYSRLQKVVRGQLGEADMSPFYAQAAGATQAEADANCVAAINDQRSDRYGYQQPATGNLDTVSGLPLVADAP